MGHFDSYMQEYKNALAEDEASKNALAKKHGAAEEGETKEKARKEGDMVHSQKMSNALKILERMVNQNAEDEVFQDFKYWEDVSDWYRGNEGSLPLWRFSTERTKRNKSPRCAGTLRTPICSPSLTGATTLCARDREWCAVSH